MWEIDSVEEATLRKLVLDRANRLRGSIGRKIPFRYRSIVDADDILQEALVAAFVGRERFRAYGPYAVENWLRSIVMSKLLDTLRRLRALKRNGERSYPIAVNERAYASQGSPSCEAAFREVGDAIWSALAALPEKYQQAVTLRFVEGLSHREIAAKMDRSCTGVNSLICRGLRRLRADLAFAREYFIDG